MEAIQLCSDVASTGMGRGVEQAVARHDAVLADASHPTVPQDVTRPEVDELGSPPATDDVAVGGLVLPATMMVLENNSLSSMRKLSGITGASSQSASDRCR